VRDRDRLVRLQTYSRIFLPQVCERRDTQVSGALMVETVIPRRAEGTETGKLGVDSSLTRQQTVKSATSRMLGTEHGLAQITVASFPPWQPLALLQFRSSECLLSAVIDAGNAERVQLQCHGRNDLVI